MTDAMKIAGMLVELLQEDLRIPDPPIGDLECADLYVKDEAGKARFLIQVTDLSGGKSADLSDCLFHRH